jgi:N-acetyl-gamma-glutamyl-phosphate reductase/acetylglutamate kinase
MSIYPLVAAGLVDPHVSPSVFGVSGYSGAGTKPSQKNDPEVLKDNLLPYALAGHMHEREVSFQLATAAPKNGPAFKQGVHFTPHVVCQANQVLFR